MPKNHKQNEIQLVSSTLTAWMIWLTAESTVTGEGVGMEEVEIDGEGIVSRVVLAASAAIAGAAATRVEVDSRNAAHASVRSDNILTSQSAECSKALHLLL